MIALRFVLVYSLCVTLFAPLLLQAENNVGTHSEQYLGKFDQNVMPREWNLQQLTNGHSFGVTQIPQVTTRPVVFSSTSASGTVQLSGTLYIPDGKQGPFPGVVLVAGSGPSDRYESYQLNRLNFGAIPPINPPCRYTLVTGYPFIDLGFAFAQVGVVALVYDKRSCEVPKCPYFPCTVVISKNCMNSTLLTTFDFVEDGKAALSFLATVPEVNPSRLYLAGHSQGVQIVPYVANSNIPAAKGLKGLLLLMGGGRGIDVIIERQISADIVTWQQAINAHCNPNIPEEAAIIATGKLAIAADQETLRQAGIIFPKLKAGEYPPFEQLCIAGCATAAFWSSWLNMTDIAEIKKQITSFAASGGKIYSLNSPTDALLAPIDYQPLQDILNALGSGVADVVVIPNITHQLSSQDFSSGAVTHEVFLSVLNWILEHK